MKIETLEQFNAVKSLGILSQAETERLEKRFARMVNKPALQEIPRVQTKTGEYTIKYGERANQVVDTGIVTEVRSKGSNKWVSSTINTGFGHGKYLYSTPEELVTLASTITEHLEALVAAGYKFKS